MERPSEPDDDGFVDVGRWWWWPIALVVVLSLLGLFADWFLVR